MDDDLHASREVRSVSSVIQDERTPVKVDCMIFVFFCLLYASLPPVKNLPHTIVLCGLYGLHIYSVHLLNPSVRLIVYPSTYL